LLRLPVKRGHYRTSLIAMQAVLHRGSRPNKALRPYQRWEQAQPWPRAQHKADHQRPPAGRTAPRQSRSQRNHATSSGCLNVASACEAVQTLVATMKWIARAARTRLAQNRREGRIFVEGGALTASLTSRPTPTRH